MANTFAYACPECKRTDLTVDVIATMRLLQDGSGDVQTMDGDGDHTWGSESTMTCPCGFAGTALEFDTEERGEPDPAKLPDEPVDAITTSSKSSLSTILAAFDRRENFTPDERRAVAVCDAADAMLKALRHVQRMIDEALPKFNWGASALNANAIRLLNEAPASVTRAIAMAEGGSPVAVVDHAELLAQAIERFNAANIDEYDVMDDEERAAFIQADENLQTVLLTYREAHQ